MSSQEWDRLLNEYRAAVTTLEATVKRFKRLTGKEFEEEHRAIKEAEAVCDRTRHALQDYLGRNG
jgi:hypothetical protein